MTTNTGNRFHSERFGSETGKKRVCPLAGEKTHSLKWSGKRGSNPWPLAWEANALPTELFPHISYNRAKLAIFPHSPNSKKESRQEANSCLLLSVGMTGFEPATSRPPDAHSNRTELHPEALPSLFVWAKVLLFFDYTSTLRRDIFPLRFGAIVRNGEGR